MKKITLLMLMVFASAFSIYGQCGPGQNIDQSLFNAALTASSTEQGNSFVAPCTGQIESLTIRVSNVSVTGTATVTIHAGDTGVNVIGTTTLNIPAAGGDITATFATPVAVTLGNTYTYMVDPGTTLYRPSLGLGDPYPAGDNLRNLGGVFSGSTNPDADFRFIIGFVDQVNPTAVCTNFAAQLDASGSVTINPSDVDGGSSDDSGSVTLSVSPNTFNCTNIGDNTVTLTATDASGNTDTCTATVTVADTIVPTVNCQNITAQLNATGTVSVVPADVEASSSDNCGISSVAFVESTGTAFAEVTENQNLTITVPAGAVITSVDFASYGTPTGSNGTYTIGGCHAANSVSIVEGFALGNNTFTIPATNAIFGDPCFGTLKNLYVTVGYSTLISNIDYACTDIGDNTVTLIAIDTSGRSSSCTATVTVEDNVAPNAVCQDITVQLNASGNASITATDVDGGSSDACGIASMSVSPSTFNCGQEGATIPVTLTVTDNNGNSSTCIANVTVDDAISPTAVCQDITIQLDASGNASIVPADVDGGSSDNCGFSPLLSVTPNTFDCTNIGPNTVTLRVGDGNGNQSTCTAIVTVEDTMIPVFNNLGGDGTLGNPFISLAPEVVGSVSSGTYYFNFNGSTFQGELDNSNGGGWLMILNYVHQAGNNSNLQVRNTDLPLLGASVLGTSEAGSASWGHFGNTLAADIDFEELRFYAQTSRDINDIINFTTNYTNAINYVKTGAGSFNGINNAANYSLLGNHTASIPQNAPNEFGNQGNFALTNFPFWRSGQAHWGIRGLGNRWEVDDFGVNNFSTIHRVWVRGDLSPAQPIAPTEITVQLDATGNVTVTTADFGITATDNCSTPTYAISQTDFDCSHIGANTIQYSATDDEGNIASIDVIVNVEDTIAPTITCPADIAVSNDAGVCEANVTIPAPTFNDNCFGATVTNDFTNTDDASGVYPLGTTTVTWTVTDSSGNVSACTMDVTVNDTELPVAVCNDITVQLDASGMATVTTADLDGGSSDNCGIASLAVSPNSFDCSNVGPNPVTLTVTDDSGNVATCTSIVTVEDSIVPTAVCQDIDVFLDASGMATIAAADVDGGSDDICGIADLSIDMDTFNCSNTGPNNVMLTVTDNNGNVSMCTAVVTVIDDIAPIISCPTNVITNTDAGLCSALVVFSDALASDNCNVTVAQTAGLPSGSAFPVGVSTVEFTATDDSGNTTSCSFTITVEDNELPTAVCQDITIQLDDTGNATITAADVDGGSNDACGVGTLAIDMDTFDCSHVGDNTVTLTVTDVNGNIATCTATVTVEDVTAPEVFCQDITIDLDDTGMVTIIGTDIDGGSTDACGIASYELDMDTFDCSNVGDNTVTLTVTDVNGNSATCTAIVTVQDVINPVVACMDLTVELDENGMAVITPEDVATITDNCGIMTTAIDIFEFSCDDIGTPVTVQVFAEDESGNLSTCTAVVTVVDALAPVITCPADQTVDPGPGNLFYEIPDYFTTGEATAVDNCTDPVTITTQDPAAGTLVPDGTYTITLTAEDEYGNISTCEFELTVESVLGINDNSIDLSTIVMYPNPATEVVYLSNPRQIALDSAAIYDLMGRLVQTIDLKDMGTEKAIDVSQLATATYAVVISGENGQVIKQLIKE